MARVYLKGLPKLKAQLIKIAEGPREQTRKVLDEAARIVVAEIIARAPWEALKKAVGYTFGVPPKYAQIITKGGIGDMQVTIFVGNTRTRTAAWAEYGTKPHLQGGLFAGTMHPGTPAQPFFFPGWRAKRNQVRKMLREQIRLAVRQGAK